MFGSGSNIVHWVQNWNMASLAISGVLMVISYKCCMLILILHKAGNEIDNVL